MCRSFIIVSEKGTPITGRMTPTTVLIQATFENNILSLNFPQSKELQVDISHVAMHGEPVKTEYVCTFIFVLLHAEIITS